MIVAPVVALVAVLLWVAAVVFATELGVPARDVRRFRNVLAVFPHADDEAVNCGGTLRRLSAAGADVTLVILTRGERGTRDGTPSPALAEIRVDEARRVAEVLGVSELIQEDFGDGRLRSRTRDVAAFLDRTVSRVRPDLVVTYDGAGLYGHDDHIACSEMVTELLRTEFPGVVLWYVALPRRLQARVRLDDPVRQRRSRPTHRVFIGAHLPTKTRALLGYRSQWEPAWLLLSMLPFEHFASLPPLPGRERKDPAYPSSNTRRKAPR